MTVLNSPIPVEPMPQQRGRLADDFADRSNHPDPIHASGAISTIIQCMVSFGLLPLLLWPTRWAEFLDTERHDLIDLAAGWRPRVDAGDAKQLDKIVNRLRPRPILMVLPWLAAGFNFVLMATLLILGDDLARLWHLTFGHHYFTAFMSGIPRLEIESHLYWAWVGTLFAAYFCQWYAVRSHVQAVNSLVNWTNRLARESRLSQVNLKAYRLGLNPVWILIGIGLSINHAWWAIPMVLAGAMQRTYTTKTSSAVRVALASQARSGFAVMQNHRHRFCATVHCGARLPAPAKFCPRCGTAA